MDITLHSLKLHNYQIENDSLIVLIYNVIFQLICEYKLITTIKFSIMNYFL